LNIATTPADSVRDLTMMTRLPSTMPGLPTATDASPPTIPRSDSSNRIASPGRKTPPTTGSAVGGPRLGGGSPVDFPPAPFAAQAARLAAKKLTGAATPNQRPKRINFFYNPDGERPSVQVFRVMVGDCRDGAHGSRS